MPSARRGKRHWPVTAAIVAAALAILAQLAQDAWHGFDTRVFLRWFGEPVSHARHPGYLLLGELLHVVLGRLGLEPYDTLLWLSVLGTALSLGCAHRALLAAGCAPRTALHGTLLVAALPAITHFGSVVEIHGIFLFFANLAWWLGARLARSPTLGRAVALAAASAVGALVHATGHVVPLLVLAALPVLAPPGAAGTQPFERRLRLVALTLLAHAGLFAAVFFPLRALWPPSRNDDPAGFLLRMWGEGSPWADLPSCLWTEWLLPYAVASLAALAVGVLVPTARRAAFLLHLAVVGMSVLSAVLLRDGVTEFGAYHVPLALPLGLLLARACPGRLLVLLALGGAAVGAWHLLHPARPPADLALGRALRELRQELDLTLVTGDLGEFDGAAWADPRLDTISVEALFVELQHAAAPTTPQVLGWLEWRTRSSHEARRVLVFTDAAVAVLTARVEQFAAAWRELTPRVRRERLERPGLRGWALRWSPD